MTKPILAIDFDDTLLDENNAIRRFVNQQKGFTHEAADYLLEGEFHGYWERIWQLPTQEAQELYEAFLHSPFKADAPPIDGAIRVLRKLQQTNRLVVITSRDERNVEDTHRSLATHYPDLFEDVHFVPLWGDGEKVTKGQICQAIGADRLIDDSFAHCQLAAECGVQAILFGNYGWNRQKELPSGVARAADWSAVEKILLP